MVVALSIVATIVGIVSMMVVAMMIAVVAMMVVVMMMIAVSRCGGDRAANCDCANYAQCRSDFP